MSACRKVGYVEKLDRLLAKKKSTAKDIDLSGEQLKGWVVNISKYRLNDNEKKVLSKGP